ncbi:hypothetical protein TWF106_006905 [Orbilia oligospora]|uniref:F-box domain-containing protein n=1 Tax=Orbilia oligospora TaxID=2813651 RepID=A0A6G1M3H8_ORBOL|nr:hypothetical protein TWF191_000377 [Orbilia oligospora]KAF3219751.1 hypothetical protein TWF106_006905 [Orbilia oligospora]KAF3242602.1 hypothetical protein TWF192_008606 [Orbilia oligospora]
MHHASALKHISYLGNSTKNDCFKPQFPPFLRLPLELQSEIISYLSFADQLSISVTCYDLSACITSPQHLKPRYPSCPFDEPSFKGLYSPDSTVPGVKMHILFQSFGDSDALVIHPELFCTVQSGEIRDYLYLKSYSYLEKPKSFQGARLEGYTWDEKGPLTTDFYELVGSFGRFADLDFETVWVPKSEEPEGDKKMRWIMHPHPERGLVFSIMGSPTVRILHFLTTLAFYIQPVGLERTQGKRNWRLNLFREPFWTSLRRIITIVQEKPGPNTTEMLIERMVSSLYEEIVAVTGPFDEVLNVRVDPIDYDGYDYHWEIGATALKSSIAELQDMVWVWVCDGEWTEYVILPRRLVEEVKGICSTESTENPP